MLEIILIIVGYVATVGAGMVTNYLEKGQKIICLIVIGIGGFVFCWFSPYVLNWVGWTCYMVGFFGVFLIRKDEAKRKFQEEVLSNCDDEYLHITKDANGDVKVRTFKVYDGGLR